MIKTLYYYNTDHNHVLYSNLGYILRTIMHADIILLLLSIIIIIRSTKTLFDWNAVLSVIVVYTYSYTLVYTRNTTTAGIDVDDRDPAPFSIITIYRSWPSFCAARESLCSLTWTLALPTKRKL